MSANKPTIAQLDFERRALRARLDAGGLLEADAQTLIRKIEDLELAIAATPATSVADIGVKALILKDALNFDEGGGLEPHLLEAIVRDCFHLDR